MKNKNGLIFTYLFKVVVCCSIIVTLDAIVLSILNKIGFGKIIDRAFIDVFIPSKNDFTVEHWVFNRLMEFEEFDDEDSY